MGLTAEDRKWIDDRLQNAVGTMADRTQEMVRDAQTEILRAMERFVTAFQLRMRTVEADLSDG